MQIPASNFTNTVDEQLLAFEVHRHIPRTSRTTRPGQYREHITLVDLTTTDGDQVRRLQCRYSPN